MQLQLPDAKSERCRLKNHLPGESCAPLVNDMSESVLELIISPPFSIVVMPWICAPGTKTICPALR